ncbi:MAG: hypothetical protein J1E65_01795 [Lachnospiraceae bacterium]|nr:hypothetical protein [Lachnospiraceae bacterium]
MNRQKALTVSQIICNCILPLILMIYPFRHIAWGVDLWDTGYNYANFRYMGMEHMDPMWLFSTYLATLLGHFFSLLPGGHTLLFQNFYTGILVALLAVLAYLFCVKRQHLPAAPVFIGVFAAISLCFCPTALLYNYLTYLLMLLSIFCIYDGLVQNKMWLLVTAGALLGTNVFVRFSNLPEMAFILAVWGYGLICHKRFGQVAKETGFCILGYGLAVFIWLSWLSLRYGFSDYITGIRRLFAMTETASDYRAAAMLTSILKYYTDNLYWVIRLGVLLGGCVILSALLPEAWKKVRWLLCAGFALLAGAWLYLRRFCNLNFTEYESMLRPGILFLMLTVLICLVRIFQFGVAKKEKLLAGLILLTVLLTPIGSNNGLYPAINNLFLVAPYVCSILYRLLKSRASLPLPFYRNLSIIPLKTFAVMFVGIFLFQSVSFGLGFVFAESHGIQNPNFKVENNAVLKGIYMSEERAEWLCGISAYVQEKGLTGKEVILFGNIPSLSFYLEMPSVFNPWSDLASYGTSIMEKELIFLSKEVDAGGELPVVILERKYALYLEEGKDGLAQAGYTEKEIAEVMANTIKLSLIQTYMERYDYTQQFANEKLVLYEGGTQ